MDGEKFHNLTHGNFNYRQLETFGELMIDLPNICSEPWAEDMSSTDIVYQLSRVACEFEAEWSKMTDAEHEDAGEDWIDEIGKLAAWVKDHLYDVLHNELEYGMYRAKKRVWGFSVRPIFKCNELNDPTDVVWVSGNKDEAIDAMFEHTKDDITRNVYSEATRFQFWGKAVENNGLPMIRTMIGVSETEYKLVSTFKDK